jgi:hypothetical protein
MLSYIVRYGSLSDRLTKCDFKHVKENRYIHVYASSMEYMIWKQGNHGNEGDKSEHFWRTSHSEEVEKLKHDKMLW